MRRLHCSAFTLQPKWAACRKAPSGGLNPMQLRVRFPRVPAATEWMPLRSRQKCVTVGLHGVSFRRIHRNARGVAVMRRLVISAVASVSRAARLLRSFERVIVTRWGASMVPTAGLIHRAAPGSIPGRSSRYGTDAVAKRAEVCYSRPRIRPAVHIETREASQQCGASLPGIVSGIFRPSRRALRALLRMTQGLPAWRTPSVAFRLGVGRRRRRCRAPYSAGR